MRLIGHIPDEIHAQRFGDYLLTQGMANDVEPSAQGWAIWVHDDDALDRAGQFLADFLADPEDARYVKKVRRTARAIRREKRIAAIRLAHQHIDVRTHWHSRMHGVRPLTGVLIFLCILVAGATKLGVKHEGVMDVLLFSSMEKLNRLMSGDGGELVQEAMKDLPPPSPFSVTDPGDGDGWSSDHLWRSIQERLMGNGFESIGRGEVWRLITPIFLHFGWLHLIFNMFWLYDLGGIIEIRRSTVRLALLVVVIAVISNAAQCWMDGPLFGGMSGVIYGLLGYIWMKQRYQPHEQIALAPNTIAMMLGWLVFCMTGAVGPVGNTAHVVGLVTGIAIGVTGPVVRHWRRRVM